MFYIGTIFYAGLELIHAGLLTYSNLTDNYYVYWNTLFAALAVVNGVLMTVFNILYGNNQFDSITDTIQANSLINSKA